MGDIFSATDVISVSKTIYFCLSWSNFYLYRKIVKGGIVTSLKEITDTSATLVKDVRITVDTVGGQVTFSNKVYKFL
ncbi:MAG: hypothetical protein ACJA1A_001674 [Saprospiraceae bacterium]|jgi:hypothetical protein|tara:strand:+ start:892 stop:1122 length:231 start_codon:yes stop_codon:yes gene_type:complete